MLQYEGIPEMQQQSTHGTRCTEWGLEQACLDKRRVTAYDKHGNGTLPGADMSQVQRNMCGMQKPANASAMQVLLCLSSVTCKMPATL